jgi:hypothetical protein
MVVDADYRGLETRIIADGGRGLSRMGDADLRGFTRIGDAD